MPDSPFAFVPRESHRHLLREELKQAVNTGALGVMLCGSVARGTARPTSDLDLRLYWPAARPFEAEERGGLLVKRHGHTLAQARAQVEAGGSALYPWVEGRILHDPAGTLAELQNRARSALAAYRTPLAERRALRHWLASTLLKLEGVASEQAAFLVHTTTWKLAEALCAVNDRPVPSATLMWETLPILQVQPEGEWLSALLLGEAQARRETFMRVADWLVARL